MLEGLLSRKIGSRAWEMTRWVKVPVAELDDLSSNPRTHIVEGDNGLTPQLPSNFSTRMCTHTTHTYTYTHHGKHKCTHVHKNKNLAKERFKYIHTFRKLKD